MSDIDEAFADEFFPAVAEHFAKMPVHQRESAFPIHLGQADSDQVKCFPELALTFGKFRLPGPNGLRQPGHGATKLFEFGKFAVLPGAVGEVAKVVEFQSFCQSANRFGDIAGEHCPEQRRQQHCTEPPQEQLIAHAIRHIIGQAGIRPDSERNDADYEGDRERDCGEGRNNAQIDARRRHARRDGRVRFRRDGFTTFDHRLARRFFELLIAQHASENSWSIRL